jgi:hypothetical protein
MKILSLGAGVQSSTLALMAEHGEIEKPDYAIFADTGWEPQHCYEWLDWLEKQLSYPVLRVSKGNIRDDLLENIDSSKRFESIPFFVDGGIGRRQCTSEYKIAPIRIKIRELLGYNKGQRIPKGSVKMMIGISRDEAQRMKPSRDVWIENQWPLIDAGMTRTDCLIWMQKNGYPKPPKSSCIGCPYHSNAHWRDMKANDEKAWEDACFVDSSLRSKGLRGYMKNAEYMHRSLTPLSVANIGDEYTVDMFGNECTGFCGN